MNNNKQQILALIDILLNAKEGTNSIYEVEILQHLKEQITNLEIVEENNQETLVRTKELTEQLKIAGIIILKILAGYFKGDG